MLTRLKVTGFKNLVDVDVRFGPFTCIAGANGVGKSNLFDAIRFLSALADRPLVEAAKLVRDEDGRTTDIQSLFHRVGDTYDQEMSFEAEMIVPFEASDDLGQRAEAGITLLKYTVVLAYRSDEDRGASGSLELRWEELVHINLGDATKTLLFEHTPAWRKSVVKGRRTSPFISTEKDHESLIIKLHQDGSSGRPLPRSAANFPRTVLSVVYAAESPTALLARREMQSWRLLQLEPSSLRKPDDFSAPQKIGADGSHLASTLYQLARHGNKGLNGVDDKEYDIDIYGQIAIRLSELIDDVDEVRVDRDERRELYTVEVAGRDGTPHPARALSDGTLRFLALAVLELDPNAQGVLCLEEPENGIHPERIPAMLQLLQDIATDTGEPVGYDNPLRQVIVNTHSPAVVAQVPDESLLVAELRETVKENQRFKRVVFSCLPNTWRSKALEQTSIVARGKLISYLNPVRAADYDTVLVQRPSQSVHKTNGKHTSVKRVVDREDLQVMIPFAKS